MPNKAMQSDSAPCHALCVPHKDAPDCYAVDGGVSILESSVKYLLFFFAVVYSLSSQSSERDQIACDFKKEKNYDITNDGTLEIISKSVVGTSCSSADFLIEIKNSKSEIIYKFTNSFSDMYVSHEQSKKETLDELNLLLSFEYNFYKSIPDYLEKPMCKDAGMAHEGCRNISREKYLKLLSQKLPAFCHKT